MKTVTDDGRTSVLIADPANPTMQECLEQGFFEIASSLAGESVDASIATSLDGIARELRLLGNGQQEEIGGALHRIADTNGDISESLDRVADGLQAIAKAIAQFGKF